MDFKGMVEDQSFKKHLDPEKEEQFEGEGIKEAIAPWEAAMGVRAVGQLGKIATGKFLERYAKNKIANMSAKRMDYLKKKSQYEQEETRQDFKKAFGERGYKIQYKDDRDIDVD